MESVLLESQYAGCVGWWAYFLQKDKADIDLAGHYVKSSFRNRCFILSPNGILRLSVPLEKGKHQRRPMYNVRISYDENWQKTHWMSLMSCYRRSAYFEYYEDEIKNLFIDTPEYLYQLNEQVLKSVSKLLNIEKYPSIINSYISPGDYAGEDARDIFKNIPDIILPSYPQVFSDRFSFVSNLSIWDVLFNLGPAGKDYLLKIDLSPFSIFSKYSVR